MTLKIEKFQSPGKGNGLRATSLLRPGDLVYTAEPFVYIIDKIYWGKVCEFCLCESDNLFQCSRCKYARYCGKHCQREAWPDHERECKCLKSLDPREENPLVRLAGRAALKLLQKNRYPSEELYSISELLSDFKDCNKEIYEDFTEIMYSYLKAEIPNPSHLPMSLNLPELVANVSRNKRQIYNDSLNSVAEGLYPSMYLLNHSCDPNCTTVFKGRLFELWAIQEIQEGEEITSTYIDTLTPTDERKTMLRNQYGFECDCRRCRTRDMDKHMLAGDKKASDETKLLLSLVQQVQLLGRWDESLALCMEQLNKNSGRLPDENVFQLKLLNATLEACKALSMSWEVLDYGPRTLGPYRLYFSHLDPKRALRMLTVGTYQVTLGKTQEGRVNLREAFDILTVFYGKDHILTKDLGAKLKSFK